MDIQTVKLHPDIYDGLVKSYLYKIWQDTDESAETFILKCVDLIASMHRPEDAEKVKLLIKQAYPVQWPRIEKLIILK